MAVKGPEIHLGGGGPGALVVQALLPVDRLLGALLPHHQATRAVALSQGGLKEPLT